MVETVHRSHRQATLPPLARWPLRGGAACLDFANTVGWRPAARPVEGLTSYPDLIAWAERAGTLTAAEAATLLERATADQTASAAHTARAIALREAIHRLFVALALDREIPAADLATINAERRDGAMHTAVAVAHDGFTLRSSSDDLALPLWRIAESAAQLLVSGQWHRVRECPGHDCGWLFLDTTKNGNRRWCDSADCGNRARVRAHYQRRHARAAQDESLRTSAV